MDELQRLLTPDELKLLSERLQSLDGQVIAAAVFGSAVRGELNASSDIDLLVIAQGLSTVAAQAHFKPTGRAIRRPANLVVFSPEACQVALARGNPLVRNVLAGSLIPLIGEFLVAELVVADLKASVPPGALGSKAFTRSKATKSKSQHVTPTDGNVLSTWASHLRRQRHCWQTLTLESLQRRKTGKRRARGGR